MKKLLLLLFIPFISFSQIPADYYDSATGTGYVLKTSLRDIVTTGHSAQTYDDLYTGYVNSHSDDIVATGYENDDSILDMYSEDPTGTDPYNYTHGNNQCGNQNTEGDCYNREHLVPQSSFNSNFPMQSDIHHVIPTDGRVNNFRGSLAFGNVASANWTSLNGSKRGSSAMAGYSGTVFEPIDEFKGDIARALLYFAVRYENTVDGYTSFDMFDGSNDQVFYSWAITVLLEWHAADPVSQHEI
ncbi:MAG: endonuclease, partial [Urechidicola sp.]|nr:endonuclease [Urechidicola sp.]